MSNAATQIATSQTGGEDCMYFLIDHECYINDGLYDEFFASLMDQPLNSEYLTDPMMYPNGTDFISPALEIQNLPPSHAAMTSLDSMLELPFGLDQSYALDSLDKLPPPPPPSPWLLPCHQHCMLDYSTNALSPNLLLYPDMSLDMNHSATIPPEQSLPNSHGAIADEQSLCAQLHSKLLSLTSVVSSLQEKVDILEQTIPEIQNELEENSSSLSEVENYMEEFITWSGGFKEAAENNAAELKQTMESMRSRSED